MKQTLDLRVGQHLTMTPQLRHAIRLLQMSAAELRVEIQSALESNLMLEKAEDEPGEIEREALAEPGPWPRDAAPVPWSGSTVDPDATQPEPGGARPQTLHEYLHWQLELTPFTPEDALIAGILIEHVNDDGYLDASLEDIRAALPAGNGTGLDGIEAVLHRVQNFDPVGVGARSLTECLQVQLAQLGADTPGLALAGRLVEDFLEDLAGNHHDALAAKLGTSEPELLTAAELVRSLHPRPGASLSPFEAEYVMPDLYATRQASGWRVELNPELEPQLRINPAYEHLAKDPGQASSDQACMQQHLTEARWLLNSLNQRNTTLLRVGGFLVRHQSEYLDQGDTGLKPLTLRDVAEALDLHESTISRITTNKWMHTPRGIIELRRFFSGQLQASGGREISATAVRAHIRRMIGEENPVKPMSDKLISSQLANMGYKVARRTVAKYREGMSIPPAAERRRAG